jgi:hypothetical protein
MIKNTAVILTNFSLINNQGIIPKQAVKAKVSIPERLAIRLKRIVPPNKSFPKMKIENGKR